MTEAEERAAVVAEAMTWKGTPYHHAQRVKGAGVDCGQFPLAVFEAAGLIPHYEPAWYPHDWHMHQDRDRWVEECERFAARVDRVPLPGDIALFQWGKTASHGAIVLEWPKVIHSVVRQGVIIGDVSQDPELSSRFVGLWSFWEARNGRR